MSKPKSKFLFYKETGETLEVFAPTYMQALRVLMAHVDSLGSTLEGWRLK